MRQYLRKIRLTFAGAGGFVVNPSPNVEKHELRVSVDVSRSITSKPNEFTVRIWNLTEAHRNALGRELDTVRVDAGYAPVSGVSNVSTIAFGNIRDYETRFIDGDVITNVVCADGDAAHQRAAVAVTHPGGTTVPDIVESIHERMEVHGVSRGEWEFPPDVRTVLRPYTMCGSCVRELDLLGRGNDFHWSIQNGVMEIIPTTSFLPGRTLISKDTGMIGAPTRTDNGAKIRCLLNPAIRPNRTVQVRSRAISTGGVDSVFRVSAVDFKGDNTQGDFVTDIHGEAVGLGGVVS